MSSTANNFSTINEEIHSSVNFILDDSQKKINRFHEIIKKGQSSQLTEINHLKLLRDLINLQNTSKSNLKKLQTINRNIGKSLEMSSNPWPTLCSDVAQAELIE